jgi:quercetin dioxygenase-like cupin family protein
MHRTASVDYAFVLEGEIWAILETSEVCLKQGDVLIQRGTNHAWSNRSSSQALVGFVLVDAHPVLGER